MRNLNLLGFLLEEEEESGLVLEAQEAARGEAPQREREPEGPLPLPLAASAFLFRSLVAMIEVLLEILRSLC